MIVHACDFRYGYTMYPVSQSVMKKAPKKIFCAVNRDGIKLFRTDDKSSIPEQPNLSFANLQSWSCVPGSTCSISLGKNKVVFQTEIGADICALLKSYAIVIVQRRQAMERRAAAKKAAAAAQ